VTGTRAQQCADCAHMRMPCRSTEVQEARAETAAAHEAEMQARNEVQELRQVAEAVEAQHRAELEGLTAGCSVAERERDHARQDRDAALQRWASVSLAASFGQLCYTDLARADADVEHATI